MYRPFLLVSTAAALAATAAFAQAPQSSAPSGTAAAPALDDSAKMVCRSESDVSSRLRRRRVCVTQAEWDEQRRLTRANVERAQTNRTWCENGAC